MRFLINANSLPAECNISGLETLNMHYHELPWPPLATPEYVAQAFSSGGVNPSTFVGPFCFDIEPPSLYGNQAAQGATFIYWHNVSLQAVKSTRIVYPGRELLAFDAVGGNNQADATENVNTCSDLLFALNGAGVSTYPLSYSVFGHDGSTSDITLEAYRTLRSAMRKSREWQIGTFVHNRWGGGASLTSLEVFEESIQWAIDKDVDFCCFWQAESYYAGVSGAADRLQPFIDIMRSFASTEEPPMTAPDNAILPPIVRKQLRLPPHINASEGHQYVERWLPADLPWIVMGGRAPGAPGQLSGITYVDGPAFDLAPYETRFFTKGPFAAQPVSGIYPALPTDGAIERAWHVGYPNATYNFDRGDGLLVGFEGNEVTLVGGNNYHKATWHRQATWHDTVAAKIDRAWPDELKFLIALGWPNNGGSTWVQDRLRILRWSRFVAPHYHGIGVKLYNPSTAANVVTNEATINTWTQEGCAAIKALSDSVESHPLRVAYLSGILLSDNFSEIPEDQMLSQAEAAIAGGANVLFLYDEYAYRNSLSYNHVDVIAHQKRVLNILRVACGRSEI